MDISTTEFNESAPYRHQDKMGAVTRLAGGLSVDVGSLVNAAALSVREAMALAGPDVDANDQLEEAAASLQRAAMIARQLGSISREKPVHPMLWSMGEKVNELMPLAHRLAGDRIRLSADSVDCSCFIMADSGQVEQILFHLVVNARDAMPLGGDLEIGVSCRTLTEPQVHRFGVIPAGKWSVLEVSDTGFGMDERTLARLFEPFFTTKGAGLGSGLGLATVYSIAQQLQGQVRVSSSPGRGTRVGMWLPKADGSAATGMGSHESIGRTHLNDAGPVSAVLVVDDDPWGRSVTSRALRHEGYGVLEAATAEEAFDMLGDVAGNCVRAVVADVKMVGISGQEFAKEVGKRFSDLVVVLTASGGIKDELPPNCRLLRKPFSKAQLVEKLEARS